MASVLCCKYVRRKTRKIKPSSVSTASGFANLAYETNENPLKEESIQLDDNPRNTEGEDEYPGTREYTSLDDEYLYDAILNSPVASAPGIARQATVINVRSCPYKGE